MNPYLATALQLSGRCVLHMYIHIYVQKITCAKNIETCGQTDRKHSLLGAFDQAPISVNHLPQSRAVFVLRYVLMHRCVHTVFLIVVHRVENFEFACV